jgi:hypothetical protein
MRIYPYLRASTNEQDANRARNILVQFVEEAGQTVSTWFIENESGATLKRPELFRLLEVAQSGDVLLVEQVDRISRLNADDWESLKSIIIGKGIRIVALDLPTSHQFMKDGEDGFTQRILSAVNAMLLDMLAAVARKDYEDRRRRQSEGIEKARLIPFQQAVGHLGYLQQTTHHEITYAVKVASRFLGGWGKRHWEWLKHVMTYLKSKRHRKFILRGGTRQQQQLRAYSDTDHITDVDTRRSISAYYILCGNDVVAWRASFQTMVSHSSCESELVSMDLTVRRVQALRWLFENIGGLVDEATEVAIDCSSAITMAENPIQNHRNCHIHARYFYVRDLIKEAVVVLTKVDTTEQLADLLCTFKTVANFNTLMAIAKPQD